MPHADFYTFQLLELFKVYKLKKNLLVLLSV